MAQDKLVIHGDETSAVAAYAKLEDQVEKLKKKLAGTAQESRTADKDMTGLTERGVAGIRNMVLGLASVTAAVSGIRSAYSAWQQDMDATAAKAREVHEELLDLFFLGENVRKPGFFEATIKQAALAGVKPGEYGRAQELFQSMTGGMDPAKAADMWSQMVEHRQGTTLPLTQIVPLYAKAGGIYRDASPQDVQNFIALTAQQAATTAPRLAPQLPRMLGTGKQGRLSMDELGAMIAVATQVTGSTEQATTAMAAVSRGLMFGTSDKAKELLAGAGVGEDMNLLQRINLLRERGNFTGEQIYQIAGSEGEGLLRELMSADLIAPHLGVFKGAAGTDVMAGKLAAAGKSDAYLRLVQLRRLEASEEAARSLDVGTQQHVLRRRQMKEYIRQRGGAIESGIRGAVFDIGTFFQLDDLFGPTNWNRMAGGGGGFSNDEWIRRIGGDPAADLAALSQAAGSAAASQRANRPAQTGFPGGE